MRVVIADDEMLLREGLARLLTDAGFEVVGKARRRPELLRTVSHTDPDVVIVDIRMPPTHTDEGLVAAQEIRRRTRRSACSCSRTTSSPLRDAAAGGAPRARRLPAQGRVSDVAVLAEALHRIADGECVLDPTIVARLVNRPRERARSQSSPSASARCSR